MLKLYRVKLHLSKVLRLLRVENPSLTLSGVQHHLEAAHALLQGLLPAGIRQSHAPWERWSMVRYHFGLPEVVATVLSTLEHLQGRPSAEALQQASTGLLQLHFRMLGG